MSKTEPMQCGWIDEFGNVFPKAAYKPERKHWDDAHKALWLPVYTISVPSTDCGEYGHAKGACGNASCTHAVVEKTNPSEKPPFEARAMQRMRDFDDAARFRWLCQNPDWHFIEMLCREFVAESADEFYRELSALIDNYRATEASADKLRDRINAAMGGRQPTPR